MVFYGNTFKRTNNDTKSVGKKTTDLLNIFEQIIDTSKNYIDHSVISKQKKYKIWWSKYRLYYFNLPASKNELLSKKK